MGKFGDIQTWNTKTTDPMPSRLVLICKTAEHVHALHAIGAPTVDPEPKPLHHMTGTG